MIESSRFLSECKKNNLTTFTGTPCSYLKPFINFVIDDNELEFIGTPNEGDAVALASGTWVGGKTAVVMFQNSGLGNAVNPLTSLSYSSRIPFLGITTWRGEPGGKKDEPQHELMGQITTQMLDIMQIPWSFFPQTEEEVTPTLDRAMASMQETRLPFFLVMKEGSVNSYELQKKGNKSASFTSEVKTQKSVSGENNLTRTDALKVIRDTTGPQTALLATTGKTGRELFELGDTENQFYMVGSMGCAAAMGAGLAYAVPNKTVTVIDGDGALLMRMGNMALAGQMNLNNMLHILLDNAVHDSTGGQSTLSETIDFCSIASACGYKRVIETNTAEGLAGAIEEYKKAPSLTFIRFFIKKGSPEKLGRPTVTPPQVSERLKDFMTGAH
ncbi:MAG: phosphonopyruvate decarboxylase [Bdellovibrio sp. CG12_big_fil_rev_8_21_14_0_65_39_13]|nr:MAG: phosphonopyruvate decarboxylase [Bdellovibrio sp. CG22_combo_CG10-13_8_21_14_all_39_27]PIQ57636.1 MAG: phosphonopyruvate decarboxylase [Bdellovibrio sp. CG12_big_fil_rev_8_21_14_0_65_39_13]PIR35800.1 MAG: phosphonopyruvate decarboxylase [Bdellovibrio sp. CG11_big_fil_rev_8_21_14_0_20_39_38]